MTDEQNEVNTSEQSLPEEGQSVKTTSGDNNKKGPSRRTVIMVLGSILIICVTILLIYLLRDKETIIVSDDGIPIASLVTEANILNIEKDIEEKVALGMFETHMNTTWRFPNGKSPSSTAVMGNSPSNNFAFWFTVTLSTGEEIFRSGLLPVGTEIAEIKLIRELPAGTYDAVVAINMVQDDNTPVDSNMGINVIIIIES